MSKRKNGELSGREKLIVEACMRLPNGEGTVYQITEAYRHILKKRRLSIPKNFAASVRDGLQRLWSGSKKCQKHKNPDIMDMVEPGFWRIKPNWYEIFCNDNVSVGIAFEDEEPVAVSLSAQPKSGKPRRLILTSAQLNSALDGPTWDNLKAWSERLNARILVATSSYNKNAQGQRAASRKDKRENEIANELPPEILNNLFDDRLEIASNLLFCGEQDISPTAQDPLSGMAPVAQRRSTIFPHPRVELRSVAATAGEGVKLMYTTGSVTRSNYIDTRKAGIKAKNFHKLGGILTEIDEDHRWFNRHLMQGDDGTMYDLDHYAQDGKIFKSDHVAGVTWGDIHADQLDDIVAAASWGLDSDSIMSVLRPLMNYVHDITDFSGRSHHTLKDVHKIQLSKMAGKWNADQEFIKTARILWGDIARDYNKTIVVNSNHDRHLDQWVKHVVEKCAKTETHENLALAYELNMAWRASCLKQLAAGVDHPCFNFNEFALRKYMPQQFAHRNVIFLGEDEGSLLCEDIDGGIECGLHGDRGPNGSRGTHTAFANLDRKMNYADKHTVNIKGEAYCAGTSSKLSLGYNKGPTSWTHAHIVTYPNGTRTIISIYKGRWRA